MTITLRETDTSFLFDLPQLTVEADTESGKLVVQENERYTQLISGLGRKTVSSETQTPQSLTKTRGTCLPRLDRKNSSTFVNNWIMHDDYCQVLKSETDIHYENKVNIYICIKKNSSLHNESGKWLFLPARVLLALWREESSRRADN